LWIQVVLFSKSGWRTPYKIIFCCFCFFFFFFCSTRVWTQGLQLDPLSQSIFVMFIFEIGSHQLFAQAGFILWSSWSLPPE
jgi:hypothetical protein